MKKQESQRNDRGEQIKSFIQKMALNWKEFARFFASISQSASFQFVCIRRSSIWTHNLTNWTNFIALFFIWNFEIFAKKPFWKMMKEKQILSFSLSIRCYGEYSIISSWFDKSPKMDDNSLHTYPYTCVCLYEKRKENKRKVHVWTNETTTTKMK